jgi:hypothetical protein
MEEGDGGQVGDPVYAAVAGRRRDREVEDLDLGAGVVAGAHVPGDDHEVPLLLEPLDVVHVQEVDRHSDLPRHAHEKAGEGQAVGAPGLEDLLRRGGVAGLVHDLELVGIDQAGEQGIQALLRRRLAGHQAVGPRPHLLGHLVGDDDAGGLEPAVAQLADDIAGIQIPRNF